jgi:hypothetical protein
MRFGVMAAVARAKCSATLEVFRPPEVQWKPPLRQGWDVRCKCSATANEKRLTDNAINDSVRAEQEKYQFRNPLAEAQNKFQN